MSLLDEDIIRDFQSESRTVLGELFSVVEKLEAEEDSPVNFNLYAEFAQKIDRIMGAAKTLSMMDPEHRGLETMGKLAENCKGMGYKASELKDAKLSPHITAFWAETLEVLQGLIRVIDDTDKSAEIANSSAKVLETRLQWLSQKLGTN